MDLRCRRSVTPGLKSLRRIYPVYLNDFTAPIRPDPVIWEGQLRSRVRQGEALIFECDYF